MSEFEGRFNQDVLLRTVVRDVIAELAPDELPFIDGLDGLEDKEVARRFARGEKDEALAFGATQLAEMLSPVVWITLDEAARRFGEKSADVTARGIRGVIRKVLHRHAEPVRVPLLSSEQLAWVRESIVQSSKERRISEKRADEIANAVVARLALPPERKPDPGTPGSEGDSGTLP